MLEFSEWIKSRHSISNNYLDLLEYMELSQISYPDTVEVGKGQYDSIVKPFNTTIITPHIAGLETLGNERVINSEFVVIGNTPVLFGNNRNGKPIATSSALTFMTQNPYTPVEIRNWENLHNSGNHNIIVGVYGSIHDKDIETKIRQLESLKQRLTDSFKEEQYVIDDTYCYAIASERMVKRLVKTRTR